MTTRTNIAPGPLYVGQILAEVFEIRRLIASGKMGHVYLANNLSTLRPVAVKIPGDNFINSELKRKAFLREVEIWTSLAHPHIAEVYFVRDDKTTHYRPAIFMAYYESGSLADRISHRSGLSLSESIDIAIQVCWAMDHAHVQGCVHRDLKPSNILLSRFGHAVVSDFGLAIKDGLANPFSTGFTPAYMPPEAWQPDESSRITELSDIYSFGVVMYELFCSKLPFVAPDIESLRYAHVHQAPDPPRQINPQLVDTLSALVMQCLEKTPSHRPSRFIELAEVLMDSYMQVTGVYYRLHRPPPGFIHVRKANNVRRVIMIEQLATASLIRGDLDEASRLTDEASSLFQEWQDQQGLARCRANSGVIAFARSEQYEAMTLLTQALVELMALGDELGMAQCYIYLGHVNSTMAQYREALDYYEQARAILIRIGDDHGSANLSVNIANIHSFRGAYQETTKYLESAEVKFRETGDKHALAACLNDQSMHYATQGKHVEAERCLSETLMICREIGLQAETAKAHLNFGHLFLMTKQLEEAQRSYQKALHLFERLRDDQGKAKCYLGFGHIHLRRKDIKAAEVDFMKASELFAPLHDHEGCAKVHEGLAMVAHSRENPKKALEHALLSFSNYKIARVDTQRFEQLWGIRSVSAKDLELIPELRENLEDWKKQSPSLRRAAEEFEETSLGKSISTRTDVERWNDIGLTLKRAGDYQRAVIAYSKAIRLKPDFSGAYSNRGNAYCQWGRLDQALEDHNKAVKLSPKCAATIFSRGVTLGRLNRFRKAIRDYTKAIELDEEFASAYANRGMLYYERRQYRKALADLNRAIELNPKDVLAYSARGYLYGDRRQFAEAAADFCRVIEINPNDADAYFRAGSAFAASGDLPKALPFFENAARLGHPEGSEYLARARGRIWKEMLLRILHCQSKEDMVILVMDLPELLDDQTSSDLEKCVVSLPTHLMPYVRERLDWLRDIAQHWSDE